MKFVLQARRGYAIEKVRSMFRVSIHYVSIR